MMRRGGCLSIIAVVCTIIATSANANLIANGDFATCDFTGWSTFLTANGDLGPPPRPDVSSFDVTGTGASCAGEFQVGQVTFNSGVPAGGGIQQDFVTPFGSFNFHMDFAAFNPAATENASGGDFSVFIDGVTEANASTGDILPGQTIRGSFDFVVNLAAINHPLQVQITRLFQNTATTPLEYVDNISLTPVATIPEPAPWSLLAFAVSGFALARRRRTH